jgi:hypothetical protein
MGLLQFGEDLLQGVQVIGDGAVEAGFPAPAFGQGNGDVFAWTSSPTNSSSFFMVSLLLVGLTIGDAAPAVLPQRLRRCTALPCNPRIRQSFKHTTFPFEKRCAPRIGSHKV